MEEIIDQNLTPKRDFIFTRLFSKKGNESFLIDFLESILEIEIDSVQVIPESRLARTSKNNKYGTLDLKVTLDNGTIVNVEMQMDDNKDIEKRSAFYAGKLMSEQLELSQKYGEITNIIMINILNYEFLKIEEYHSQTITVLNDHRDYEIENPVTYHYIELPKFRKAKPDIENKLYQWLSFIDRENEELIEMAVKKNKEIKKANEEWEYLTGDAEIKRLEFLELKARLDENSIRAAIKEEATEEGIKEGRKEEKIEIAKKMLKANVSIKEISNFTDLTEEEINSLKDKI